MNPIFEEDLQQIIEEDIAWEKLKGKTVLITGASGMIGMYLTGVLAMLNDTKDYGIRILALLRNPDKLMPELRDRSDVELLVQDVTEPIRAEGPVDFVFHAASPASPRIMKDQPVETFAANTLGTWYTLRLAEEKQADGYLFVSSREVYGQPAAGQEFFKEDDYGFVDPLDPRSCYPEGKKAAETLCVSFQSEYGLNVKIARLAHTYGPGMSVHDGRVQADFLKNVLQGEDIVLKSEGTAVRTYTYVADAVSGLYRILLNSADGREGMVYNIGDENAKVSIRGLAELLISLCPQQGLKLVYDIPQGGTKGTAPYTAGIVNSEKLRGLGWEPKYSLRDGFGRTLQFLKS